ncbi:MAG: UTP--glucose-1-phosphate uridylyltransferase GalU [Gammaproteobacteria bacterium]|nr:UTP--glucose-1-phosphate uridylyltransferase GalU [Gammaproteobacteria bacterium]MDH5275610.1 UTP--glucose-1-phosphate uridylyltransferase GalU [Gammaproteobacteria bacterium]
MPSPVRTAVFPVAGRGTRFLPATKAMPKEMLPIVDKPLVQYAVEEALEAGVTRLVFVTGSSKRAIEDHFDRDPELERSLSNSRKHDLLDVVRAILPSGVSCVYIRQGEPLGLGHAVLCARPAVGDEPFFVHLPDDLIKGETGCLEQLHRHYEQHKASVVAVQEVPRDRTRDYGIVAVDSANRVQKIVEKPAPDVAPSRLAVVGRYLLTPAIFGLLEATGEGAGGEIQLTDGIARLLQAEPVYALPFTGRRYDCGSKLGYVEATIDYALADPALEGPLRAHLRSLA